MDWTTISILIAQYGIPLVADLIQKWENGVPVTSEAFAQLRALGEQTGLDRMKARLTAAGIALDSPQAKILLGLADQAAPSITPVPPPEPPPVFTPLPTVGGS